MKETDIKIVNYIMQNCEMGISTLNKMLELIHTHTMVEELNEELSKYKDIYDAAAKINEELHGERTTVPFLQKMMADFGVKFNLMMDKSDSHIAEMLIQGTNMGIIELNKLKNENSEYDNQEILNILNDLLEFEEGRLDKLKAYL